MTVHPRTLTDRARAAANHSLTRVGTALHHAGIHANAVTLTGWGVVLAGAVLVGMGQLTWGGVVMLLGCTFDALDGAVARAAGRPNPFGALLDSTLDRYADGCLFGALGYYLAGQGQPLGLVLALAALMGSFGVSYVRARADAPDVALSVKVGWFSRMERLALLTLALLFPVLLWPVLWLLAVGTNITTAQRLFYVWRTLRAARGGE